MSEKPLYRELCEKSDSISLFSEAWWLDIVAGDHWDVVLARKGDRIIGAFPYNLRMIEGRPNILMPPMTQCCGPWLAVPANVRPSRKTTFEIDVLGQLIDSLPKFDKFEQRLHHSCANWLPFYWRGFSQTTKYTYFLPDISDPEKTFASFRGNIKTDIRKAEKQFEVQESQDVHLLYEIVSETFARQNRDVPFTKGLYERVFHAASSRRQGMILVARDAKGKALSSALFLWNRHGAYYLASGNRIEARGTGANSLIIWKAIELLAGKTRAFDFEGSMMPTVEPFFRAFGGELKPFFHIAR